MLTFDEYDVVRVCRLLVPDRPFQGSPGVSREPRVGDVGAIVQVAASSTDAGAATYIVECVADNGYTVWMADFSAAELELVSSAAEHGS